MLMRRTRELVEWPKVTPLGEDWRILRVNGAANVAAAAADLELKLAAICSELGLDQTGAWLLVARRFRARNTRTVFMLIRFLSPLPQAS